MLPDRLLNSMGRMWKVIQDEDKRIKKKKKEKRKTGAMRDLWFSFYRQCSVSIAEASIFARYSRSLFSGRRVNGGDTSSEAATSRHLEESPYLIRMKKQNKKSSCIFFLFICLQYQTRDRQGQMQKSHMHSHSLQPTFHLKPRWVPKAGL